MVALYVGITDRQWFDFLRRQTGLDECNFWQPSGHSNFRALQPGELFLFKLHSPHNFIVGGGIFARATNLPVSLAWEAFGIGNGAPSFSEMRGRIARYRKVNDDPREDYHIGCRILTQPFFLEEREWLPVPESWKSQTQVGKTFRTDEANGLRLWEQIKGRRIAPMAPGLAEAQERFGAPHLIEPRLGQGAFRIIVTDAYQRRCAFTGEKVLPALEAAHIRPYADGGEHVVTNGLLLRRDFHTLFDRGYMTVTTDQKIEVSRRIKDDFDNGRTYYALHGKALQQPERPELRPARDVVEWHNARFLG
jgi:putative restriction endonuclease